MTTKILREYVKKHLLPFVQEYKQGFKLEVYPHNFGFRFIYEDTELIQAINFRLFKGVYIHSNGKIITLKTMEKKMIVFLKENGFELECPEGTIRSIPSHNEGYMLNLRGLGRDVNIKEERGFIEVSNSLKIYLSQLVFPFFDKYSTIKGVSEALNEMTVMDMLTYLDGTYPIQFYKAMYISYHAGDFKRYEEIKTEVLVRFEKIGQREDYKNLVPLYEKVYQKLIELLEGR